LKFAGTTNWELVYIQHVVLPELIHFFFLHALLCLPINWKRDKRLGSIVAAAPTTFHGRLLHASSVDRLLGNETTTHTRRGRDGRR